jgi:hypothetical protein
MPDTNTRNCTDGLPVHLHTRNRPPWISTTADMHLFDFSAPNFSLLIPPLLRFYRAPNGNAHF